MLPKKYTVTHSQWSNYEQLATIREHIHAGQTLDDLKLITVDDKVEYVLHKGNPNINSVTVEKNPLGPFQKLNGYVVVDLLEEVIK